MTSYPKAIGFAIMVGVLLCFMQSSCKNGSGEIYLMEINFDGTDVSEVHFIKALEKKAEILPLKSGTAKIILSESDIKDTGSIELTVISRTYGDMTYTDTPVRTGRHLKVNFYNGKITIQVISAGYL